MKTFFQKLLLSIPLRPFTAILFCFIIGYLGFFIPKGYMDVTYIEDSVVSEIRLPIHEELSYPFLDVNYCLIFDTKWLVEPSWYLKQDWFYLLSVWAILLSFVYYMRYVPNSYKKLYGSALAFASLSLIPAIIFTWIGPDTFNCLHKMKAVVHGISIEWLKIMSWVISLPLGIYALYKRDMIEKNKASS
jgi:hypothetical protein